MASRIPPSRPAEAAGDTRAGNAGAITANRGDLSRRILPRLAAALSLLALVWLAYLPGLRNDYVAWDDTEYIRENPHLRRPDGLRRIWFTFEAPQYYPLTFSSYWLEFRLWADAPTGYYATNVTLHALNAVLVCAAARAIGLPPLVAWLAALLFALHPVQVASVAWLAERKNVLSGLFALLTMLLFLRSRRTGGWLSHVACVLSFAAGLLAKTAIMPLPLSLWALDRWAPGRPARGAFLRVAPLLALSAAAAFVTYLEEHDVPIDVPDWQLGPFSAAAAIWFYVGKILWPTPLLGLYPKWQPQPADWHWWLPIVALILAAIALFLLRRRLAGLTKWSAVHFVLMLSPMLGLVPFGYLSFSPVADHFLYLALLGPVFAVVHAGVSASEKISASARAAPVRRALTAVALALCLLFGLLTAQQTQRWHDAGALWSHTLQHNPGAASAHNNLGLFREQHGRIDEAYRHYLEAVRLNPRSAEGHNNLAKYYESLGDFDRALAHAQRAVRLRPKFAEAFSTLAAIMAATGRYDLALLHSQNAASLKPDYAPAYSNWGAALFELGRVDEAIEQYQHALRLNPHDPVAHTNVASAYAVQGRFEDAARHYRRALELRPDDAFALSLLGLVYLELDRPADALPPLRRAVALNPADTRARAWLSQAESRTTGP